MEFKTVRAAKDYLAKRIIDQAVQEGAPLTDVERKMLYFTEDGGLSPSMAAVSEEFDRDYDQDDYEEKIGGLVQRLLARPDVQGQQEDWDNAAIKLCDGDNYLTVLINASPAPPASSSRWEKLKPWLPTDDRRAKRDGKDFLRMIVSAFAVLLLMLIAFSIREFFR
jgi:hypothetical protein